MYFNLNWSYWGLLDRAESRDRIAQAEKKKKLGKGFEIEK